MTSSNIVGSSSATSTIGGAAFAFTMTMIEELACVGQVLSSSHSSKNLVGTLVVDSTSSLLELTYFTIVGM